MRSRLSSASTTASGNLYYSVNPTRTAMCKKAAKTDIAAIEYVLADLDPADGETLGGGEGALSRAARGAFEPRPTAVVDSGNGIQCLWRLQERDRARRAGQWEVLARGSGEDRRRRGAHRGVMQRLGSKAGTQNIDRILRLPGTTNLPKRRSARRGASRARPSCCGSTMRAIRSSVPERRGEAGNRSDSEKQGDSERLSAEEYHELIEHGVAEGDRSEHVSPGGVASRGAGEDARRDHHAAAATSERDRGEVSEAEGPPRKRNQAQLQKVSPPTTRRSSPSGMSSMRTCLRAGRAPCCRSSRPPRATPISSCCRRRRFTNGTSSTRS